MTGVTGPIPESPLAGCRRFVIPTEVAAFTLDKLAAAGRDHNEGFVVWGATVDNGTVHFRSAIQPEQRAIKTPHGLLVEVSGQALFDVNRVLYKEGQILAGQVHSHPQDAFHSDTDDCFSLVTLQGALSVVVPDFASAGLRGIEGWAWYRLVGDRSWRPLEAGDAVQIAGDP